MAEDRMEPREINFRQWLPWTQLFRGFWVALDPKKLLLAAAGILVMAVGWWLLAIGFFDWLSEKPEWGSGKYSSAEYQPKGTNDPKAGEEAAEARDHRWRWPARDTSRRAASADSHRARRSPAGMTA